MDVLGHAIYDTSTLHILHPGAQETHFRAPPKKRCRKSARKRILWGVISKFRIAVSFEKNTAFCNDPSYSSPCGRVCCRFAGYHKRDLQGPMRHSVVCRFLKRPDSLPCGCVCCRFAGCHSKPLCATMLGSSYEGPFCGQKWCDQTTAPWGWKKKGQGIGKPTNLLRSLTPWRDRRSVCACRSPTRTLWRSCWTMPSEPISSEG